MRTLLEHHHIQLKHEEINHGHLILVNSEHPVRMRSEVQSLEDTCKSQLEALLKACQANDEIVIVSGYRSQSEQQHIYETSFIEHGADFTKSYVARPGESEHQTGLAVDVGERKVNVDFIRPAFPDHGACKRFKQLAAKYGFIQRYQEHKQSITKIACEPWHYRYVGFPHSMIMEQEDLCLEEYTEFVKQFTVQRPYLYSYNGDSMIKLYYVPADMNIKDVPILQNEQYHLSGNNKDGFVITVFSEQGSTDHGF